MAITEPVIGKFINLRCVEISDAEFTLSIRNDGNLTKFIPRVNNSIETQKEWIAKQRLKDNDYFFIIENKKGEPLGTISCYDIDEENGCCEVGRFISRGEFHENVEASFLLSEFIGANLRISRTVIHVDERNKKIMNYNKRLGYKESSVVEKKGWKTLYMEGKDFLLAREKICKMIEEINF